MSKRIRRPTAERREQIANVALRILAENGTAGLTAKNIGAAAGISDGALFKHFETKDAIVEAAIGVFESMMAVPTSGSAVEPLERLKSFFLGRLALIEVHPHILELAFSNSLGKAASLEGEARVRRAIARSVSYVRTCLREGQRSGTVSTNASASVLTWMVLGVIQAAAQRRIAKLSSEQIWSELESVIADKSNETTRGSK